MFNVFLGVKNYSLETWKITMNMSGKERLSSVISDVTQFYIYSTYSANHMVAEAALAAISGIIAFSLSPSISLSPSFFISFYMYLLFSFSSSPFRSLTPILSFFFTVPLLLFSIYFSIYLSICILLFLAFSLSFSSPLPLAVYIFLCHSFFLLRPLFLFRSSVFHTLFLLLLHLSLIVEIVSKLPGQIVYPYLDGLMEAVVQTLRSDSWPVRDAACLTAGIIVRHFPDVAVDIASLLQLYCIHLQAIYAPIFLHLFFACK